MLDRKFCRQLLREYHACRCKPYHIRDTLFLLSLLPTSFLSTASQHAAAAQTSPPDAHLQPVHDNAIDMMGIWDTGLAYLRRALRGLPLEVPDPSRAPTPSPVANGSLAATNFLRSVEHGTLFWLMRRLSNIRQHPHRVPSAGSIGVQQQLALCRPGSDVFPLMERFLPFAEVEPSLASTSTSPVPFSLRLAQYVRHKAPTETLTAPHGAFRFRMSAEEYQQKFVPTALSEDGAEHPPTHLRFRLHCVLQHTNPFMRVFVVNSQLQAVDISTLALIEEVGTLVNPVMIPFFSKAMKRAEQRRYDQQQQQQQQPLCTSISMPPPAPPLTGEGKPQGEEGSKVDDDGEAKDNEKDAAISEESWSATWMLPHSDGPVLMKGLLYVKVVVMDDAPRAPLNERMAHEFAYAPVHVVPFGPIALRSTV